MKLPLMILWLLFGSADPYFAQSVNAQSTLTAEQRDAEIRELHQQLNAISARLNALESTAAPTLPPGTASTSAKPETPSSVSTLAVEDRSNLAFLRGTNLSLGLDGYYGYNFNSPTGRVNLLRAYDVTSNSFNINQASIIIEHLPTPAERMGGRLDLQFGQATETLQGSPANEQRPQVWRNLFQAYGSYLAPVGSGLQIDFGKWASSLGNEGNYTKDQIAYSRAYSFYYLPFYHTGMRASYNVTTKLNVAYWLVNGANDTEDLNGFKSQAFLFTIKPSSTLSWNVNYYFGQEARDVQATLNPGLPSSPTQPGLPAQNISPAPNGREHIFDTYATWAPIKKLTLVPEADFVVSRTFAEQKPGRVAIGSLAAKYALPYSSNIGARFEYLDDRGGLFSGSTQALKEGTIVLDHLLAPSFLIRGEYRRDFSNQRFFLTDRPSVLSQAQTTATLGLVYWWGTKQGSW